MARLFSEEKLLDILQNLIQIESVNPSLSPGGRGEAQIAQYIGNYLSAIGLETQYQAIGSDRSNVIGILKGTGGGKTLMLNGHTDTVGIKGMRIASLLPEIKDGRVYGRGSLDMKSGLAAMIMAVRTIADLGIKLTGDVILAFVADEEYKSLGTEALIQEFKADAAIVCEPTNLGISPAHKGFAWLNVEVFGKAAHGSKPEEGIDAIVKAGKFLCETDRFEKEVLFKKKHPLLGCPSLHASLIEGGIELSTYPDYCKIQLERRTLPGESPQEILGEIHALIHKIQSKDQNFKARCELSFYRPALEVPLEEKIVQVLRKAYKDTQHIEPKIFGSSGWLDSAILAEAGIPTVIFGPGGEGMHSAVEYADFESVAKTAEVLIQVIIDYCGKAL
jgi:acetylornithine deacetylase